MGVTVGWGYGVEATYPEAEPMGLWGCTGAADPIRSGKDAGEFASGVPRKICHDHP